MSKMAWRGVIDEYRERLPLERSVKAVTLLEGNTPLIPGQHLVDAIGFGGQLFLKHEGLNPTASFKDRGMSVAITAAVRDGARAVICASTGNTSASAAAYAARAGLEALVLVPEGKIALGKLSQAVVHGARVVAIDGGFDDALRLVRRMAEMDGMALVNSVNPFRIQGQKTAAFEICDALSTAPDYHFLPVGNAGNITAYWTGYTEYRDAGLVSTMPRMMGFQAAGAAPIVLGHAVPHPVTVASAIRIGDPASWHGAAKARDESGGVIESVTDSEILEAYRMLAELEGVFAEPASAASVAGFKKMVQSGRLDESALVVCTLTGHGLKDPATATEQSPDPVRAPADLDAIRRLLHT